MKVVDKYGLAKQPYGTAFYNIDKYGNLMSGLRVLTSDTFYAVCSDAPMFNGVFELEPDLDIEDLDFYFDVGWESNTLSLYESDDSDADYNDDAMFLVLTKDEALQIINLAKDLIEGKTRL